jgi:hypothetical protein
VRIEPPRCGFRFNAFRDETYLVLSCPPGPTKRPKLENGSAGGEEGEMEVIVAVQQENLLATAFHPELTEERWWHQYFVDMVRRARGPAGASSAP